MHYIFVFHAISPFFIFLLFACAIKARYHIHQLICKLFNELFKKKIICVYIHSLDYLAISLLSALRCHSAMASTADAFSASQVFVLLRSSGNFLLYYFRKNFWSRSSTLACDRWRHLLAVVTVLFVFPFVSAFIPCVLPLVICVSSDL